MKPIELRARQLDKLFRERQDLYAERYKAENELYIIMKRIRDFEARLARFYEQQGVTR